MQNSIPINEVRKAAEYVISRLPEYWKQFRIPQLPRICEELSWIYLKGGTVVDLGGSNGFHCAICTCLGMKAICVDNFRVREKGHSDDHFYEQDMMAEEVATELGVEFIHTDLIDWTPPFEPFSIDVVMSFDNIEHLHHSPRKTYTQVVACLKRGGKLIIGAPNAVNILKRARVPLGKNIFSPVEDWYLHERFVGHVREPVVSDLLFIARDLNLNVSCIVGRNRTGLKRIPEGMQLIGEVIDRILRPFPSLCSEIYLLAVKER